MNYVHNYRVFVVSKFAQSETVLGSKPIKNNMEMKGGSVCLKD